MFHKQNARQPVAAALLSLLLILSTAFSCIGLSGWASLRQQLDELDAQYTTVAYPSEDANQNPLHAFESGHQYFKLDDGSYQDVEDGTIIPSKLRIMGIAENAPDLLSWNTNVLAAAHTPNQKGFSSGSVDPMLYNRAYDYHRYSYSVMAVRCISSKPNPYERFGKVVRFEWVEPVCRIDAYDLPEHGKEFTFYPYIDLVRVDSGEPIYVDFEVGKTYLIRGDFIDFETHYWMRQVEDTESGEVNLENYWHRYTTDYWVELTGQKPTASSDVPMQDLSFLSPMLPRNCANEYDRDMDAVGHPYPLVQNFCLDTISSWSLNDYKDSDIGYTLTYIPEDSWPFYTEYEGDWRDFLNTEEGKVWRDEIIPCCETSHDSVPLLLTDNVQGLSQFCKEESALLEGRFITEAEYKTGAAVCLVGADYALYNGLQVGDTLALDLYKPAYATCGGSIRYTQPVGFNYTQCMPLVEENRLDVTRDYTIVGLYSAPVRPCDPDGHGFRGDTVLAPKASAPEVLAVAEEDKATPLLNTLVLKNGSIEEFEAYMAENGAANRFLYYDYGYSEMKESIEAMEDNALRLAVLGGTAFLIGGLVFLLASFARMSAPARSLRLLGAGPNRVTGDMLSALLPLTAAGVAFGGVLGGLLYGTVCEAVLSQTLAPDWPGLAVCAALELLVLGAVAAVWAALMARRGLMKRKQE